MPLAVSKVQEARPRNPVHYFPSLGSTMIEAARLSELGAVHGTVVIADEQTAGIGRLGRNWISSADVGIYCSILLRLNLPPAQLPVASLLLGLAVAEAIQNATSLVCDLRWPFCDLLDAQGPASILRAFSAISSYANGRRVTVEEGGLQGITHGLDECGFLLLQTSDGKLHRLSAGGVRAAP